MTHYDFLVGDNGSGKNSVLTTVAHLAYLMLLVSNVSAPNVFTFLGARFHLTT
jgi:recombinational DNA repair ATPase RecF